MSKKLKCAFVCIAKDKEDIIERMLDSTKGVFDLYCLQDTGSSDKTIEKFKQWCEDNNKKCEIGHSDAYKTIEVQGKKTLADFASARNDSFKLIKDCRYVFWMDTDDVLEKAELIPEIIKHMNKDKFDICTLTYDYAVSREGLVVTGQKRERIIDLKKEGQWIGRVHEGYHFKTAKDIKGVHFDDVKIVHKRTPHEAVATSRRNHMILKDQEKEDGIESFTEKNLWDIAYDHWEWGEYDESIKYFLRMLKEFEGDLHPERLYQVYIKLGRAYLNTRDEGEAVKYAFKAAKLNNKIADAYLIIGEVYANIGNWKELEYYAKKILEIGKPNTPQAINEADYMLVPLRMLIQAYLQLGNLSEAIETANKLVKIAPNNPQFIKERHEIIRDRSKGDYVIGLAKMYKYMVNNNRMEEAIKLLALIPDELKEHPMLQNIVEEIEYDHKRKTEKIKLKTKKKIDFLVGPHFEKWNGESDVTTGIGGSEGMTIQMARELAKLGNAVTVWCETDGGVFDGVEYSNYKEWSTDRPTDVLIGVRGWGLSAFQNLMNAKKQYLWLHDTDYGDYPQSSFYYPNRVFVLSEFHKEIIMQNQGLTDASNFYVTRNALNKSVMDEINGSETLPCRDMSRIIYASSYDRGLDNALRMWPKIKKEVPEAELHIFYGWNTFDALMNQRGSARMQQYKNMILELMRQDGVFEHGRISQKHLYNEFLKSNIWFYPTEFEEISCINAMTAQALGTFPVCTPKAALNETVSNEYGIKVGLDQIADALIYKLKQTKDEEKTNRFDMIEWAGKRFDIVPLAKEWDRLFIND